MRERERESVFAFLRAGEEEKKMKKLMSNFLLLPPPPPSSQTSLEKKKLKEEGERVKKKCKQEAPPLSLKYSDLISGYPVVSDANKSLLSGQSGEEKE